MKGVTESLKNYEGGPLLINNKARIPQTLKKRLSLLFNI